MGAEAEGKAPEQKPSHPAAPGRESEGPQNLESLGADPSESEDAAGSDLEAAGAELVEDDLDRLLEDTQRERDEYLDLAQRTKADFDNYRKRMAAETEAAAARGRAELAGELIGVIDDLERALEAADVDPGAALSEEASVDGPLEQGVVLTYRALTSALRRAGVEPYDPHGESFDPAWHEALGTRPVEGIDAGQVVEVLQKGYRLDGQVLRAARVMVSE